MKTKINNSVVIAADRASVFQFLFEVENHKQLHPLIINVEKINEINLSETGIERIFLITDKIKLFGLFTKYQKYTAIQYYYGSNFFTFDVPENMGISVRTKFYFEALKTQTVEVTIEAEITAPFFLLSFVKLQANKSHKTLLINCKKFFEKS